jgi:DNA-binding protein HU-beta
VWELKFERSCFKMTKIEITEAVIATGDTPSKAAARRVVDEVFKQMTEALKNGDSVQIAGFGTIEIRERKARMGINPQTKKLVERPAHKTVCFKPAAALKKLVNVDNPEDTPFF